jgi:hypothetical protein
MSLHGWAVNGDLIFFQLSQSSRSSSCIFFVRFLLAESISKQPSFPA